jgi:hypothetical protein
MGLVSTPCCRCMQGSWEPPEAAVQVQGAVCAPTWVLWLWLLWSRSCVVGIGEAKRGKPDALTIEAAYHLAIAMACGRH